MKISEKVPLASAATRCLCPCCSRKLGDPGRRSLDSLTVAANDTVLAPAWRAVRGGAIKPVAIWRAKLFGYSKFKFPGNG